jgi:hypothetical protein
LAVVNDGVQAEITSAEVLQTIRNLLKLANHGTATEAEAANALARANALLIKHNLSEDEVARTAPHRTVEDVGQDQIDVGATDETWRHRLAVSLAHHNLCEVLYPSPGTTAVIVIGRTTNVAVTQEMYAFIEPQFERLADDDFARLVYERSGAGRREFRDADGYCQTCQQWATDPTKQATTFEGLLRDMERVGVTAFTDPRTGRKRCGVCRSLLSALPRAVDGTPFKEGFMRGMLARVDKRLRQMREGHVEEVRALVVTSKAAIETYKQGRFVVVKYTGQHMPYGDHDGFARGHRRGDDVRLVMGSGLAGGRSGPALGGGAA